MTERGFGWMARAKASLAEPRLLFGGALGWGLVMVASYLLYEWRETGLNRFHIAPMLTITFLGGVLGWLSGLTCARFFGLWRRFETRLAATLFFLCIGTMGFTMVLLALQFRQFYAQWHDPFLTKTWIIQQLETTAGAVYQFLVLGLPHYLPLAFPALIVTSFAVAKRMR